MRARGLVLVLAPLIASCAASDPRARLARGTELARSGAYEAALAELEPLRGEGAAEPDTTIRIAAIWSLIGRSEDALAALESLGCEEPDDVVRVRVAAAHAALSAERWERARDHAHAALRLRPRLDVARLALADACAHLGDDACAERALDAVRDPSLELEAERLRATIAHTIDRRAPSAPDPRAGTRESAGTR